MFTFFKLCVSQLLGCKAKLKSNALLDSLKWFLMRVKVSYFGNKICRKDSKRLSLDDDYIELSPLSKSEILELNKYYEDNLLDSKSTDRRKASVELTGENIKFFRKYFTKKDLIGLASNVFKKGIDNAYISLHIDEIAPKEKKGDKVNINKGYDNATSWHRDIDHYSWFKVFYYLKDVNCIEDGAHQILLNTTLPSKYTYIIKRYDTEYLLKTQKNCRLKSFFGKAGYGFAENTFCFHKGTTPINQSRRIMTLVFYGSKPYTRGDRAIELKSNL